MNFASRSVIYENPLGCFTCRKAGTWDILFYFPSEGRHTEDFPDARKIQRLGPGLNPRTWFPVVSMLTTRPPKPSKRLLNFVMSVRLSVHPQEKTRLTLERFLLQIILMIIICINCDWVIARWQWLFYMHTNMEKKVTR